MNDRNDDFEKIYHETFLTLSKYLLFRVTQISDMEDLLQNVYSDLYTKVLLQNRYRFDPNRYDDFRNSAWRIYRYKVNRRRRW